MLRGETPGFSRRKKHLAMRWSDMRMNNQMQEGWHLILLVKTVHDYLLPDYTYPSSSPFLI
jgi:hypothetical protein